MIIVGYVKVVRIIKDKVEIGIEEISTKKDIYIQGNINQKILDFQTRAKYGLSKIQYDKLLIVEEENNEIISCITASTVNVNIYEISRRLIPMISENIYVRDRENKDYEISFDKNTNFYDGCGFELDVYSLNKGDSLIVIENIVRSFSDMPCIYAYGIIKI